jgi:hypothetical protein
MGRAHARPRAAARRSSTTSRVFGDLVPAVPLQNNPSLLHGGRSDLDPVIPLQNALNKLIADMLVASEFSAFRSASSPASRYRRTPRATRRASR